MKPHPQYFTAALKGQPRGVTKIICAIDDEAYFKELTTPSHTYMSMGCVADLPPTRNIPSQPLETNQPLKDNDGNTVTFHTVSWGLNDYRY